LTEGKRVTYKEYLKKYCGCEGAVCTVKPSKLFNAVEKSEESNDVEESLKGVKPFLLITQERVDLAKFKQQLHNLDKKLAKCDRKG
jgi:hypothetical protein